MGEGSRGVLKMAITAVLIFQLTGCGTLLYPERRGRTAGRLDPGVVILDALGLLFGIIPGVIAFAVDFSSGCIYFPARPVVISMADLKQIRFDPRHTSLAQIERIIKDQTGYTVKLTEDNTHLIRLSSTNDMIKHFAQASKRGVSYD